MLHLYTGLKCCFCLVANVVLYLPVWVNLLASRFIWTKKVPLFYTHLYLFLIPECLFPYFGLALPLSLCWKVG